MTGFRRALPGKVAAVLGCVVFATQGHASDPKRVSQRVESRMVLVPVTVTDRNGKSITDLRREQFQVFDDSTPMEILSFSREEAPVSMGIVLDLSGSMRTKIGHAVGAVRAIAKRAGPRDEAFLVTFSGAPEVRAEFTGDVNSLVDPLLFTGARGATALIDAVYLGLQEIRRAKNPRRVLVVVSDGGDNSSRYTEAELSALAVESDTQIYSISLHESVSSREERSGVYFLSKLSQATGGLHFTVRDRRDLPEIAEKLATAINNLYVIGYRPPNDFLSGKWRNLKVRLEIPSGRSLRVTSRTGYFPD